MMILRFVVLFLLLPFIGRSQSDSASHLRISLLTVGVGEQIYASFGHTGIRVADSVAGTDIVYNWGTFDGFQKDFELKFMRGKLLYYCSSETFFSFYSTYVQERRGVEEQVLLLPESAKKSLQSLLIENLKEENKYYKYDFLYDNCATRPRDVFPNTFGTAFKFGRAIPENSNLTFRNEINHYLRYLPWERFGINLLLGSKIDKVMSIEDAMFLPDYLRDGIAGATLNGKPIATKPVRLLSAGPDPVIPGNVPLVIMLIFLAILFLGYVIPGFSLIGLIARNALLFTTGVLGCLILFMWLGTDHQACQNNWNILWALPTNLLLPFVKSSKRSRYAILAIALIVVSLFLHILHVQALPLGVIWPLLGALLLVYAMMFLTANYRPTHESTEHHHH